MNLKITKPKLKILKQVLNFKEDVENKFFYAVIYGISHIKLNGMNITFENIKGTLGERLFLSLKCIKQQTKLDHTLFGYFERCQKINEVLTEFGYFLRFYDWRNKFRYLVKKKLKEKNENIKELSACVVRKFNRYETLRSHLNQQEKKDFIPIDIVYEPTLDDTSEIECFFAYDISLAFFAKAEKTVCAEKKKKLLKELGNVITAVIIL